ncbi:MAG: TIGR00730 family Rossman fold protein [Dermabacteraceae bacterium]
MPAPEDRPTGTAHPPAQAGRTERPGDRPGERPEGGTTGRGPSMITLFSGSATGGSDAFTQGTAELARALAATGVGIVYGGGRVGLMGTLAGAAMAAGGEVHGVMPQSLVDAEIAHEAITHLDVVPDMHSRKLRMAELGDAFVALPGGAGTLEELFEVWAWQHLGIHTKPVALYDIEGYWQPLLSALDAMTSAGFLAEHLRASLIVADEPQQLLTALRAWHPPVGKWSRRS